jgi:hypothetical protein
MWAIYNTLFWPDGGNVQVYDVWVVMDDLTMTQLPLAKSKSGDSAMPYFD